MIRLVAPFTLGSTTATEDSGLFGHIVPLFRAVGAKINVHVVAIGAQALSLGERGEVNALLVHDRPGEGKFVADGHGTDRRDVMCNDFVIVGPKPDPAGIQGLKSAREALARIAAVQATFVSQGDDSGTNRLERRLWRSVELRPDQSSAWYRQVGQRMGATLNIAAGLDAYTLTDRATWANFKNRRNLEVHTEHDPALYNPYSSIPVNPAGWPSANKAVARLWHEWLTSKPGVDAITSYRINGEQAFFPVDKAAT